MIHFFDKSNPFCRKFEFALIFFSIHFQVVIHLHKPVVRVCLMHLIATNLAIWVSACTREIVEDMSEDDHTITNVTVGTLSKTEAGKIFVI